ncbi:MAG TPA: NAD(P)H-hydrate dehydratase [Actinomycetota bacterium]|nr:NAD(P)H-hydrate dehydratase [Actinomycetota bacterium]
MEAVLTPSEMREADESAIRDGTPAHILMDRAAAACTSVALRMTRGGYGRRVLCVCGKGSNGGDGIAVARHLAARGAWASVLLVAQPSGAAAVHLEAARRTASVRVAGWSPGAWQAESKRADLVVDAVFGTGFSGEATGPAAEALSAIAGHPGRVLSVDMASGVDAGSGAVDGPAVHADVTVAVQALKVGHVRPPGALRCGRVDVADIGIPLPQTSVKLPDAADVAAVIPRRAADSNKYSSAVAVVAGSSGMSGAAVLTVLGALGAGAGMVMAGVPQDVLGVLEVRVPEAVKVGLDSESGMLTGSSLKRFDQSLGKARALAVGPGLGRGPGPSEVVRDALRTPLPVVLDADGLWALAELLRDQPDVLRDREAATVLTPHAGEFRNLLGREPGPDLLDEARRAAREWGAVVHLKGPRAITATPKGEVLVNATGGPGLASAGTGDVLTGVITALIAGGAAPAAATWAGAWLHGAASDSAVKAGPGSATASELSAWLPRVLRRVAGELPFGHGPLRTVLEGAQR